MQDNQRQTHTDWAYIAGIMDSDGCFMITRHKRKTQRKNYPHMVEGWSWTYMPSVKVAMINHEAIEFIVEKTQAGTCNLYGARPSRPNSHPMYEWGIRNRKQIVPFIENIMPYLKVKKQRAQFLLDYCKKAQYLETNAAKYYGLSKEELEYRESSYQQMKELNRIKVAATTKFPGPVRACDSLIS
ncbi:MAG: hypothetical protein ABSB40_12410 [Nitrososphaeria archaeon]|jgi:hypothetical protein